MTARYSNDAVVTQRLLSALEADEDTQRLRCSSKGSGFFTPISNVLVIYTGGTIGMMQQEINGYVPVAGHLTQQLSQLASFHDASAVETSVITAKSYRSCTGSLSSHETQDWMQHELKVLLTPISIHGKRIQYGILEYSPLLDSCNMSFEDYISVARDIELNYESFDAFIVLHGTDTMAYTASALSFLCEDLGKTVILTGSQIPLSEMRNDAVDNLLGALTIAGHYTIPEVTLYFDRRLLRGNRAVKIDAMAFDAFDSPNFKPLVTLGVAIDVQWHQVWRPLSLSRMKAYTALNENISVLRLHPSLSTLAIRSLLALPALKGVILESFGVGNVPSQRQDFLDALKEACERGVVIVNCSQCLRGCVRNVYETGKVLTALGVVMGGDMTTEAALMKLSYLSSKYPNDPHHVRQLMSVSLRGEMTTESLPRFHAVSSVAPLLQHFINEDVTPPRDLISLLQCTAAARNDLIGLRSCANESYWQHVTDYRGQSPLHLAARGGHLEAVEFLLKEWGLSVHAVDDQGQTPLWYAVLYGHDAVLNLLLQCGSHLRDKEKVSEALFGAARRGEKALMERLLLCWRWEMESAVLLDDDKRTLFHVACFNGHLDIVQFLLTVSWLKNDLFLLDRWGRSACQEAEMHKDVREFLTPYYENK